MQPICILTTKQINTLTIRCSGKKNSVLLLAVIIPTQTLAASLQSHRASSSPARSTVSHQLKWLRVSSSLLILYTFSTQSKCRKISFVVNSKTLTELYKDLKHLWQNSSRQRHSKRWTYWQAARWISYKLLCKRLTEKVSQLRRERN